MQPKVRLFISYRRDDSQDISDRLYDFMVGQFGKQNVFQDVTTIPIGFDFRKYIRMQIEQCAALLVMIGPSWEETIHNRSIEPDDYVRIEIEAALELEKLVIPILVRGATMPNASNLPESIRDLIYRNAFQLRPNPDFWSDAETLANDLVKAITPPHKLDGPELGQSRYDAMGMDMVWVPPGTFRIGTPKRELNAIIDGLSPNDHQWTIGQIENEMPTQEQTIEKGFWLDMTPVTNRAFAIFVSDNGYSNPEWWTKAGWEFIQREGITGPLDGTNYVDDDFPRIGVSWFEAIAYARWRGGSLPTEVQWEWAARGPANRIYPWGNQFDANRLVFKDNSGGNIAKVGSTIRRMGASWVGALDMSGNVWEWISTIYYPYVPGLENIEDGDRPRIMKGGSADSDRIETRSAVRASLDLRCRAFNLGFRICKP